MDECVIEQVSNPIIKDIVSGKLNIRDYIVMWDIVSDSWGITKKKDQLELQPLSDKLKQIPIAQERGDVDIHITVYKKELKAMLSVSVDRIVKDNNLSKINNIVNNDFNLMNLFVCKKNDPDCLIAIIEIDAYTLLKNKKLLFDFPESILEVADIDNVSLFTIPLFSSYGLNYSESFISTPDLVGERKIINNNAVNEKSKINIYTVNSNTINIQSMLEEFEFSLFKGLNTFNMVVCDEEYDNLVGNIELSVTDLITNTSLDVELPFDIPVNPLFLYRNNNISVSYNGEKHEQHS